MLVFSKRAWPGSRCAPNEAVQLVCSSRRSCALQDRKMHGIFRSVTDGTLNINPKGVFSPGPVAVPLSQLAGYYGLSIRSSAEQGMTSLRCLKLTFLT